jgi:tetratricopeptide (TPR) repeat protein
LSLMAEQHMGDPALSAAIESGKKKRDRRKKRIAGLKIIIGGLAGLVFFVLIIAFFWIGSERNTALSSLTDAYYSQSLRLLEQKDYNGAIEKATLALKMSPSDIQVLLIRAAAYNGCREADMAVKDCNQVLKLRDNVEALSIRGDALFNSEKYEDAAREYGKALTLLPTMFGYMKQGDAYFYLKAYDKAIDSYTKGIGVSDTDVHQEAFQEKVREAEKLENAGISQAPLQLVTAGNNAFLYQKRALAYYYGKKDFAKATEDFQIYFQATKDPLGAIWLYIIRREEGKEAKRESIAYLKALLEVSAPGLLYLLFTEELSPDSIKEIYAEVQDEEKMAAALFFIGKYYSLNKDAENASANFISCAEGMPENSLYAVLTFHELEKLAGP